MRKDFIRKVKAVLLALLTLTGLSIFSMLIIYLGEYYPELIVDRKSGHYTVRKVEDVETERDRTPAQDFFKDFRLSRGI